MRHILRAVSAAASCPSSSSSSAANTWLFDSLQGLALPQRCMSYAAERSTGVRRVSRPSSQAAGGTAAAATAGATEASSGAGAAGPATLRLLEMDKEVPGGRKPLATWEKYYWGGGVVAVAFLLFKYVNYKPPPTAEELEARAKARQDLEVSRHSFVKESLMMQNFLRGERDPLDGLSPAQIEKFMAEAGIDEMDPLEGLSPEEIDAYMEGLAPNGPPPEE